MKALKGDGFPLDFKLMFNDFHISSRFLTTSHPHPLIAKGCEGGIQVLRNWPYSCGSRHITQLAVQSLESGHVTVSPVGRAAERGLGLQDYRVGLFNQWRWKLFVCIHRVDLPGPLVCRSALSQRRGRAIHSWHCVYMSGVCLKEDRRIVQLVQPCLGDG